MAQKFEMDDQDWEAVVDYVEGSPEPEYDIVIKPI